jgi:hypothetical protein
MQMQESAKSIYQLMEQRDPNSVHTLNQLRYTITLGENAQQKRYAEISPAVSQILSIYEAALI